MPAIQISDKLKHFIFQHIDSVELIEVLLYVRAQNAEWKSVTQVNLEIRSTSSSVLNRLNLLTSLGMVEESPNQPQTFRFSPKSEDLNQIAEQLADAYRVKRFQILELIFSSTKQAKYFADAFVLKKGPQKKGDDENG